MKLSDVTALGRTPIDPSYPTNIAIAVLALGVTIAGTIIRLISGGALLESALWGIGAGFTLFLTWALGRELDPDHDLSAFVGAGLVLVGLWFFDAPSLLLILWLLLVLRLVNRTVGLPAKPLDLAGGPRPRRLVDLAGLLDSGLDDGRCVSARRPVVASAQNPSVRFGPGLGRHGGPVHLSREHGHGKQTHHAGCSCLGDDGWPVPVRDRHLSRIAGSGGCVTGKPLNPRRVQAAQFLALLTALLFAWWAGGSGVVALLPLWAAMLGVSLYRLAILFLLRSR